MLFHVESAVWSVAIAILAVGTAYLAIRSSRTPQGAVGWIVLILASPLVGIPAYALFGYANYNKFERRRRSSDARLGEDDLDFHSPAAPDDRLDIFSRLAGARITEGNHLELLIDGDEIFDALVAAIGRADHYVLVQYYIISDDSVGRRVRDALAAKAREGVQVYVLHDALPLPILGGLPRSFWKTLEEAGARIARPKGPTRALGPFQMNYRNHRKMVIVDGREGYTGGANLGERYAGGDPAIGAWRDTFARLRGPMVAELQRSFCTDWAWATGENLVGGLHRETDWAGEQRGLILPISPTDRLSTGNLYFLALAASARRRLWITTPYIVPDAQVTAALQLAALRGVDLRILVPGRPDHWVTYWAAYAYYDDIRRAGGEIWIYEPAFTHQKVALIDDDVASVGSVNLDVRSGLLNFELTAVVEDRAFAGEVEAMLERDFAGARKLETDLSGQPATLRVLARASRLVSPVL